MKLNKLLNFKNIKILIVVVLSLYILYNIYYGTMKSMEAFKVESKDGIIDTEKLETKMRNKIEEYKNLIDKLDNINTDLKSV
jgi:hypothetical protein